MTFRIVKFNHKIFLEEDTMKKFAKIAAVALVVVLSLAAIEEYAKKNDSDSNGSDWEIKQSGAMIYYGTKAGISAAR